MGELEDLANESKEYEKSIARAETRYKDLSKYEKRRGSYDHELELISKLKTGKFIVDTAPSQIDLVLNKLIESYRNYISRKSSDW